ncbi:MAG: EAL domain-containing protein [Steroidobacteraceae bacterium]|nr:EAL domain-containing protein [Nevskiaceae bacterium]MCP5339151.1 EAL domain-containing protein [Nevskiaceae bacterium]MCP5466990.1 EAL domain-containing protein [Nevskiaceae bacterium]MCP5472120.1 EAL domain-containing protein [Nevskiaceae bacterium]
MRRFAALAAIALLFLAGVALILERVLLPSYESLETDAIRQSTEQVVKALQAEVRQIAVVGNDYASWDEMYAFVRDRNAKFAELNFSKLGLREMDVDAVFVVDETGREIYSAEQRATDDFYAVPATEPVRKALQANLQALNTLPEERDDQLVLRLPDGVAVVDASPIIQTDRTGPSRGTLVFVRRLGPETLARISSVSQLPVAMWDLSRLPDAVPASVVQWAQSGGESRFSMPLGDEEIAGYARLAALDGTAAIVLGTHTSRAVYQQGQETKRFLLVAIVFMVVLVIAITVVLDCKLERSTRQARVSETLYRAVVEQAEEGIILLDPETHTVLQANPAVVRLSGRGAEDLHQRNIEEIVAADSLPLLWGVLSDSAGGARAPCEVGLRRADGSLLDVEISASPVLLEDRRLVSLLIRDVSQRKLAEARLLDHQRRLEHLANHDPLTGLPNRLYLNFRLPGLIDQAGRDRASLAVYYIDVDHFKHINDSSGHEVGDGVLCAMAERLRHIVSKDDLVARISGDEFVVVSIARDPRAFEKVATRVTEHLREPLTIDGRNYAVSVSLGVSVYPRDGFSAPDLLRSADIALYQAKERGRDNFAFFADEMNVRVHERMQLEQALRIALSEGQLSVHYQPLVDLKSERIAGLEALARWKHPEFGDVPPAQFIPVAEECGLIVELGEVVLRQVCAQLAEWSHTGIPVVPVAVNVSAQQLQRTNIRDRVLAICSEYDVAPGLLQIELTESTVMREIDRQIGALEGLRAAGVRISIDDFGTGYSSLSYLKHLPIDHLKIDRSFVRDMAVDTNDAAIVNAIISMARSLKLETIAEGVETAQHALRLASLGCDFAQGYYFSGPLPAEDCRRLLAELSRRAQMDDTQRLRVASSSAALR